MTALFRFAPSPTGQLHIGNARIAVVNWLFAKKIGAEFMLRMDDTDTERSTDAFAQGIEQDMRWMGLEWDQFARQSDRLARYDLAIERLKEMGRLYACYETPEELDLKRKIQLNAGRPPIYDRAALKLTDAEKAAFEAEGRTPHWRFLLEDAPIEWHDFIRGDVHFEGGKLSDPVLIRADGRPLYTISSCVDDIELNITHILRGEDHVSNTAVQVQLIQALGGTVPQFGHMSLLTDASGAGLSKRLGSLSLASLREQGINPVTISAYLARLGTSENIEPRAQLADVIAHFDIDIFSRATPKFDPQDLINLNGRTLQLFDFADVQAPLAEMGLAEMDEEFWLNIRGNLTYLADAKKWWDICYSEVTPDIDSEDADFIAEAAKLLPATPWTKDSWATFTTDVKQATGRKGKKLFMPLRKALTGQSHGPELPLMLVHIGPERALKRLQGDTA